MSQGDERLSSVFFLVAIKIIYAEGLPYLSNIVVTAGNFPYRVKINYNFVTIIIFKGNGFITSEAEWYWTVQRN